MQSLIRGELSNRRVGEPPAAIVGYRRSAWKTDEVGHFVQHDERAELAIGNSEKSAPAQKDPVQRDIALLVYPPLQKETVRERESDPRIARGIRLKRTRSQRA